MKSDRAKTVWNRIADFFLSIKAFYLPDDLQHFNNTRALRF